MPNDGKTWDTRATVADVADAAAHVAIKNAPKLTFGEASLPAPLFMADDLLMFQRERLVDQKVVLSARLPDGSVECYAGTIRKIADPSSSASASAQTFQYQLEVSHRNNYIDGCKQYDPNTPAALIPFPPNVCRIVHAAVHSAELTKALVAQKDREIARLMAQQSGAHVQKPPRVGVSLYDPMTWPESMSNETETSLLVMRLRQTYAPGPLLGVQQVHWNQLELFVRAVQEFEGWEKSPHAVDLARSLLDQVREAQAAATPGVDVAKLRVLNRASADADDVFAQNLSKCMVKKIVKKKCTHCGKTGHTADKCFQLHPPGNGKGGKP